MAMAMKMAMMMMMAMMAMMMAMKDVALVVISAAQVSECQCIVRCVSPSKGQRSIRASLQSTLILRGRSQHTSRGMIGWLVKMAGVSARTNMMKVSSSSSSPSLRRSGRSIKYFRGVRSLPVRKVRLSSSVRFVSTTTGGRSRWWSSRRAARTAPERGVSERREGAELRDGDTSSNAIDYRKWLRRHQEIKTWEMCKDFLLFRKDLDDSDVYERMIFSFHALRDKCDEYKTTNTSRRVRSTPGGSLQRPLWVTIRAS